LFGILLKVVSLEAYSQLHTIILPNICISGHICIVVNGLFTKAKGRYFQLKQINFTLQLIVAYA
jgi:hypothetical protein